jgi:phage head maturation protease
MRICVESGREAERAGGTVKLRGADAATAFGRRRGRLAESMLGAKQGHEVGQLGTLTGHFAVFNRWMEINSDVEGRFMERIWPGAFRRTVAENLGSMSFLFQHGRDPLVGTKPLGPIRSICEDGIGAAYEVPLFDTAYNLALVPGLKARQYCAGFHFQVVREEVQSRPRRSYYNPEGIEERTIIECKVLEFGPVTFNGYDDATAVSASNPRAVLTRLARRGRRRDRSMG